MGEFHFFWNSEYMMKSVNKQLWEA